MLKKTLTYEDFNGEMVSEDYFFHLSKAELVELELSHQGGLSEALQRIIEAEDGKGIVQEFKNIILTAYGKRSDDGKRFIKNQQLREEFESTEAYSALFIELVTNTDSAVEFINGVIPQGMVEEAAKLASVDLKVVEESVTVLPSDTTANLVPRTITKADLVAASVEEVEEMIRQINEGTAVLSNTE